MYDYLHIINFLFVELLAGALLGKAIVLKKGKKSIKQILSKAIVLKKGKNQSSKSPTRLLSSRKEIINQSIIQSNHQLCFICMKLR